MLLPGISRRRITPLAFPGTTPGFDRTHIACKGNLALISVVATGGGSFNRVDAYSVGTVVGTVTGGVSNIGPVCVCSPATANNCVTYITPKTGTPTSIIYACIFTPTIAPGSNSSNPLLTIRAPTSYQGPGLELRNPTRTLGLFNGGGGGAVSTGIALTLGTPYFIAVSMIATSQNWVIVNLGTGQLNALNTAGSVTFNSTQSPWGFGGWTGSSTDCCGGQMAAGLIGINGAFLSLADLQMWAADPWSFWYPDRSFAVSPFFMSAPSRGGGAAVAPRTTLTLMGVG